MKLIDAELTAKNIAKARSVALECGNGEMNKMMECYINPIAFSDGVSYGMELAQKVVSGQPTAYDTDKVVEQIHDYFKGQLDIRCETLKFADEIPIDVVDDLLSHNKAVCNIVEKGGAEWVD